MSQLPKSVSISVMPSVWHFAIGWGNCQQNNTSILKQGNDLPSVSLVSHKSSSCKAVNNNID